MKTKEVFTAIVLVIILLGGFWYVKKEEALQECLDLGYPKAKMTIKLDAYCIDYHGKVEKLSEVIDPETQRLIDKAADAV